MMEEISETRSEEIKDPAGGEREGFQELDEITTQPEAVIERTGNIEVAEGVEAAFVNLMDITAKDLDSITLMEKEEEDGEYRVCVKIPLISNEDDGVWARVGTLMSDGRGSWFMPEIEDTVLLDTDQETPRTEGIQPVEKKDESDDIRVKGEEIKPVKEETDYSSYNSRGTPHYVKTKNYVFEEDRHDYSNGDNPELDPDQKGIRPTDIQPVGESDESDRLRIKGDEIKPVKEETNNRSFDEQGNPVTTEVKNYKIKDGEKRYTSGENSELDIDQEASRPTDIQPVGESDETDRLRVKGEDIKDESDGGEGKDD